MAIGHHDDEIAWLQPLQIVSKEDAGARQADRIETKLAELYCEIIGNRPQWTEAEHYRTLRACDGIR